MSSIISSIQAQVESAFTIAEMEARKIRHDSTELWARAIQPALWLLIFGEVFSGIRAGLSSTRLYIPAVHRAGNPRTVGSFHRDLLRHNGSVGARCRFTNKVNVDAVVQDLDHRLERPSHQA